MQCVDGYYYNPLLPSEFNVYDKDGNRIGHNGRNDIKQQELSNNIFVAAVNDPDDTSSNPDQLYGAFNLNGDVVIPFKYYTLSAFRGSYTVGQTKNDQGVKTWFIVGSDGKQITEMSDGSTPLSKMKSQPIPKAILYTKSAAICTKSTAERRIATTRPYTTTASKFQPERKQNVVMNATMSAGSVLYAPTSSPSNVFVFDKVTGVRTSATPCTDLCKKAYE